LTSDNADLDWVSDILAAAPLKRTVGRRQPRAARETFAVLPTASRPRFLVSLASRRGAAAAVGDSGYAPELQVRLAHALGRLGITLGIAGHVFRDRLSISEGDMGRDQPLSDLLLSERLATIFGRRDLTVAVRVGRSRPNRKPLVRVLSHDGTFLGYVKVGWNDLTRQLVRNEARVLGEIDRRRSLLTALEVPRVVYSGKWRHFELLALTPLRGRAFRMIRRHLDIAAAAMSEIPRFVEVDERPLADSEYWHRTKTRAQIEDGSALASLAGKVEDRFGDDVLAYGFWHGDWAPWNMAWRDGRVAVWDWERSTHDAPVGLDAAHFDFQVALSASHNRSLEALGKVLAGRTPMGSARSLSPERQRLLLALHLLEMALRWEEGRRAGMSPLDSIYVPALAAILD
jgi:Phosphotransferase enzyme family